MYTFKLRNFVPYVDHNSQWGLHLLLLNLESWCAVQK